MDGAKELDLPILLKLLHQIKNIGINYAKSPYSRAFFILNWKLLQEKICTIKHRIGV